LGEGAAGSFGMQVLLNIWCVAGFAQEVSGRGEGRNMRFWGNTYDTSMAGFRVGFLIWVHYNNKFVELLDTLWMLLRKKNRQVCACARGELPLTTAAFATASLDAFEQAL
jgi:hypothetical protein